MAKHRFLLSITIILSCFFVRAINFSRVNVAWQYDVNADLRVVHRVVKAEKGNYIFLRVLSDYMNKWKCEFLAQERYESENHRTIESIKLDTLQNVLGKIMVKVSLFSMKEKLLVLKISRAEDIYYYDVSLAIGNRSFPSVYPIDNEGVPIVENFINKSGFSWRGNKTFLARKYKETFLMASPPMAEMKPLAPQMEVDTFFVFGDSVIFMENHFYVILKNSFASVGVTMLCVPPYFPAYHQLGKLIESMLYLTSEQEKNVVLNSKNLKQSFDFFWRNAYSTKIKAQNAIRNYYNLIERVNRLFTDYKPGWKTDRGMIYLVFGLPNEVYRTANLEEWYYDNGKAFEFVVLSTFFAPRTYSLRRNKSLEEQWYNQVATLRRSISE